ncbi:MAG TPA: hypothetical protein VJB41_02280 [Patescibacteria group bacterium]|nr:hypothetical protein [Patescibacteria group bacterium]
MKVFWVPCNNEDVIPYEKKLLSFGEEFRFLFWEGEDDILLVGAGKGFIHEEITRVFMEKTGRKLPKPNGAGSVDPKFDSKYIDWKSYGYGIETPKELRPKIMTALGLSGE